MPTKNPAVIAAKQARWIDKARTALTDLQDARHGTRTGYTAGCRCQPCKAADGLYRSTLRKTKQGA